MKNQHTPGPWTVRGGNVIENEAGVNVAKAWMTDCEEECANAHLIASAPDLLSALRFLLADYIAINGETLTGSSVPADMAMAAIAKAEGAK